MNLLSRNFQMLSSDLPTIHARVGQTLVAPSLPKPSFHFHWHIATVSFMTFLPDMITQGQILAVLRFFETLCVCKDCAAKLSLVCVAALVLDHTSSPNNYITISKSFFKTYVYVYIYIYVHISNGKFVHCDFLEMVAPKSMSGQPGIVKVVTVNHNHVLKLGHCFFWSALGWMCGLESSLPQHGCQQSRTLLAPTLQLNAPLLLLISCWYERCAMGGLVDHTLCVWTCLPNPDADDGLLASSCW